MIRSEEHTFTARREATAIGSAAEVYDFLERVDCWPGVHPAVARVRLDRAGPGVQLVELDMHRPAGPAETVAAVRLCLPERWTIVHKELDPPAATRAHTGRWTVAAEGDVVRVSSTHTVTLDRDGVLAGLGSAVGLAEAGRRLSARLEALDEATLGCALDRAGRSFAG